MTEIEVKLNRLARDLRLISCPVIAFSGGVLSTFLAAVAKKVLRTQVYQIQCFLSCFSKTGYRLLGSAVTIIQVHNRRNKGGQSGQY